VHDAGVQQTPPTHDTNDAATPPSDAGTRPIHSDAALNDAAPPDTTKRGAAFDPCASNSECASGLCTAEPSTGASTSTHGYCTMGCGPNGWTAGGSGGGWTGTGGSGDPAADPIACAQPSSGSVTASCQYPGLCLLDACDTGKTCPDGLDCVQTQTPTASPSGQVVWVSACQVKATP
jgi:hypothetical protein